jgi:hypothetical protein
MQSSAFPKTQLGNGRTIHNPRRDIKMGNDRRRLRRYDDAQSHYMSVATSLTIKSPV